jgi:hypothetical protein
VFGPENRPCNCIGYLRGISLLPQNYFFFFSSDPATSNTLDRPVTVPTHGKTADKWISISFSLTTSPLLSNLSLSLFSPSVYHPQPSLREYSVVRSCWIEYLY